jgi:hypothetical protein
MMSKVSWSRMLKRQPAGHLVVGLMPRSGAQDRAELDESRRRIALLARLLGALGLKGMYAMQAEEGRSGLDVRCAFEKRADADKLVSAIGSLGPARSPGWESERSFRFDDAACAAIEAALETAEESSPSIYLPRLTGEVARRARGPCSFEIMVFKIISEAFPLRPV